VNLTLSVAGGQQDGEGSPFGGFRHKKEDETRTIVQIEKELAGPLKSDTPPAAIIPAESATPITTTTTSATSEATTEG
jgi:hypothetical protein